MNAPLKFPSRPAPNRGIDDRVFRVLRTRVHPRPLEVVISAFSVTGNYGFFWLGLAAVLWLLAGDPPGVLLIMPLVLYPTMLVNFVIKSVLGRERPVYNEDRLRPLVGPPKTKSFPSSHAAMSFAAALFLTVFHPGLWPVFFGIAFLMSWSRVYVGVHYPSDVLAGTVVGLAAGGLILFVIT